MRYLALTLLLTIVGCEILTDSTGRDFVWRWTVADSAEVVGDNAFRWTIETPFDVSEVQMLPDSTTDWIVLPASFRNVQYEYADGALHASGERDSLVSAWLTIYD